MGEKIKIEGLLIKADTPTINGHVYPKDVMRRAIEEMQDKIKARQVLGAVGPNQTAKCKFSEASHMVTDLSLEDGRMVAEVEVLDTPAGKVLEEYLKRGRVTLHPVFLGSVNEDGVIGEDARIAQLGVCPLDETGVSEADLDRMDDDS